MKAIARFIVRQKSLIVLFFILAIVYSIFGFSKVNVNYDIASFLDKETDTYKALQIMKEEFVETGSAKIMLKNVSFAEAESIVERIKAMKGVKSLTFADSETYYKDGNALLNISFRGTAEDRESLRAYDDIVGILSDHEVVIASGLRDDFAGELASSMMFILLVVGAVILIVLIFTSQTYIEVIIFPIVFIVAGVLNMGTNYWLGTISFITHSIAIILQLALAIDYSIILCHAFAAEKEKTLEPKIAIERALLKAIPDILSSSMTTISGLVALVFMQLRIGADMGYVLAKGILCSILTVLCLMPALLIMINKAMDKTKHKKFVPKITVVGKFAYKSRKIVPFVFIALTVVSAVVQSFNTYAYSETAISSNKISASQMARNEISDVFGSENVIAILVPAGDYSIERQIMDIVLMEDLIKSAIGLSSIKINDDYYITDEINYVTAAELVNVREDLMRTAFMAHGVANSNLIAIASPEKYTVPIIDLMRYVIELNKDGFFDLEPDAQKNLDVLTEMVTAADEMLMGINYNRLVFSLDGEREGEEIFALVERINDKVKDICPDAILAGSTVSSYDLDKSFTADNILISVLTIFFVLAILLLTFKSFGLAVLLVFTIQGAIFLNFAIAYLTGQKIFFFAYLVVSAIQMGATIDYAIVLTSKYNAQKKRTNIKNAMINAVNDSFPTIITSGSILIIASFLIGFIVPDPMVSSIGMYLGIGSLISVLSVLLVLPSGLLFFDKFNARTMFKVELLERALDAEKGVKINGRVKGNVSGFIDAKINGTIKGDGNLKILNSEIQDIEDDNAEREIENLIDEMDKSNSM